MNTNRMRRRALTLVITLFAIGCSEVTTTPTAVPPAKSIIQVPYDGSYPQPFVLSNVPAIAGTLVIGAPPNSSNAYPFGGFFCGIGTGTRYQQAYSASQFTGPVRITAISFTGGAGALMAATYTFYLSTITTDINALSGSDFDGNRGADNAQFAQVNLSGGAPATLTITGSTPFSYTPSAGNLLLDMVITGASCGITGGRYDSRDNASGIFSRYQNFGYFNQGFGLVTTFTVGWSIDDLLAAVADAIDGGRIRGVGTARDNGVQLLKAWQNMLLAAQVDIEMELVPSACDVLQQAYLRADAVSPPKDFVAGAAVAELAAMIENLRDFLGCSASIL